VREKVCTRYRERRIIYRTGGLVTALASAWLSTGREDLSWAYAGEVRGAFSR
jgi:hypothetical protein